MDFKNTKIIFLIGLIVGLLIGIFILLIFKSSFLNQTKLNNISSEFIFSDNLNNNQSLNCSIKEEKITIQGYSLGNILKDGEDVKLLAGYYNCNNPERGDIVAYKYPGSIMPIAKIIKGVPGDKFDLKKVEGGWNILINNQVVLNSENKPYILDNVSYKILMIYVNSYNGIIPEDAYIILGDLQAGSLDSTRFGLIGKSDLVGKIIK